MSAKLKS